MFGLMTTLSSADRDKGMPGSHVIPFESSGGLMMVEATVDGTSGYFIFDSGSEAIILNNPHVQNDEIQFKSLSGELTAARSTISSLSLSGYRLSDLEAYTSDLSHLSHLVSGKFLGILGTYALQADVIRIDIKNSFISIYNGTPVSLDGSKKIYSMDFEVEGDLIILPISIADQQFSFLLDTGASASIISTKAADQLSDYLNLTQRDISLTSTHGEETHQSIELPIVELGQVIVQNLELIEVDLDDLGISFDGILSLEQLNIADLILDFTANRLYFSI